MFSHLLYFGDFSFLPILKLCRYTALGCYRSNNSVSYGWDPRPSSSVTLCITSSILSNKSFMASSIFALHNLIHIETLVEAWRLCWRLCPPPKRDLNSPSHIWESSQIKTASENVSSVLWQSSHSTEWILSRRHLSVAALPTTSSYLGRPDCPDCDRCRSRVEIWSNCKTTLSLFIQGDIFTAPQAPI